MTKNKIFQVIFICAGIITITGAILQITNFIYAPYIFTLGTVLLVFSHIQNAMQPREDNFRQKRVSRIGFISSLFLLVSSYLMFTGSNSWVVFLLIYALTSFFLSFRTE